MSKLPRHLPGGDRKKAKLLKQIIRVDHAGEFGAKRIYQGQISFLKNQNSKEEVKHMLEQELVHLKFFEQRLIDHNIQPTRLKPLWQTLAFGLGAFTGILGDKAAMLCTVAVENVIEKHYSKQIDALAAYPEEAELSLKITQFRNEELEHRDKGLEYEIENSISARALYTSIQIVSKMAIWLSKRI